MVRELDGVGFTDALLGACDPSLLGTRVGLSLHAEVLDLGDHGTATGEELGAAATVAELAVSRRRGIEANNSRNRTDRGVASILL